VLNQTDVVSKKTKASFVKKQFSLQRKALRKEFPSPNEREKEISELQG
jgi:hypothetical protein